MHGGHMYMEARESMGRERETCEPHLHWVQGVIQTGFLRCF
jgi:hypothetical protein